MINRTRFFAGVRNGPFPGKISASQVKGCEAILSEWERRKLTDTRHLAYMLATAFHETAQTMQPITEYGSQRYLEGKTYWPWIGRGYVQLTWEGNYKAMTRLLRVAGFDIDLTKDMDAALKPDIAAFIMFEGMQRGTFTGKKLSNYFSKTANDPVNARRIINGTDRAADIATIHKQFLADLLQA